MTTTPFDMVMMNDLDRFSLGMHVIERVPSLGSRAAVLRQEMVHARLAAKSSTREHGEEDPVIVHWTWGSGLSGVPVLLVGHRVVHGGTASTGPVRITGPVRRQLADLTDLAPRHPVTRRAARRRRDQCSPSPSPHDGPAPRWGDGAVVLRPRRSCDRQPSPR